jgi:RNA polymerase sigma-70 factor (ECF subfamily)
VSGYNAARLTAPVGTDVRGEVDEVTLERARRGDRAAWEAITNVYARRVFALLGRMIAGRRHRSTVDDLAQETFLRVYRALPQFKSHGPARLSTWILTIAARLAVAELRRKDCPLTASVLMEGTDDSAGRMEVAWSIERAVGGLPPIYRAAFLLREVDDLSYEEIAQALEIDIGTVKSRLARARQALQSALAGRAEEASP